MTRTSAAVWVVLGVLLAISWPTAAGTPGMWYGSLAAGPIEQFRGIYLQRAIELATVGSRLVRLTRMTRFRRCGHLHAQAQDFNTHIVEVTGREVDGVGFVAGFVNAIEGCSPAAARSGAIAQ